MDYLSLPHLENDIKIDQRQLDVITLLKETAARYNRKHAGVHCTMLDLCKAYDRINIVPCATN